MTTDRRRHVSRIIGENIEVQRGLLEDEPIEAISRAAALMLDALNAGGKILMFGNGGSATDASHLAAEFTGRFQRERRPLPAISLCDNQSALTAVANDYGFEHVFSRQVQALAAAGDVVIGISTSGVSPNVLAGVQAGQRAGASTIGLTGAGGGRLRAAVDCCIRVPSDCTARVQEGHILIAHLLCDLVERDIV